MASRSRWTVVGLGALVLAGIAAALALFLVRPFLALPQPAKLHCLDPEAGGFAALPEPEAVYGLGLSYAGHIQESPGLYEPGQPPPSFKKRPHSVNRSGELAYPTRETLLAGVANLDPQQAARLDANLGEIPVLLDYEVEIGLVVLESFPVKELDKASFAPPVGYFVANDVTARVMLAMAPHFRETVAYLAEAKSLPGFLPVGDRMWVPAAQKPDSWVCVDLVTEVNGEVRQQASSRDIIVGPREILKVVATRFSLEQFKAGDWVITGTPPGVAMQTPGWLQRALKLVDPSAETKVSALSGSDESGGFLAPGDVVRVRAGFLGEKQSRVAAD